MKCKDVEKNLIFYIEKNLSPEETTNIEDHLRNCEKCTRLVDRFSSIYLEIENTERIEPNPFFWTRVKQRLNEPKPKSLVKILQPAAVTIMILVGITIGYWLGSYPDLKVSEQQLAAEQIVDNQLGELPPDSVEEFYMNLEY